MKKTQQNIMRIVIFILIATTILFYYIDLHTFSLVVLVFTVIYTINYFIEKNKNRDEKTIYKSELKDFLKTYDAILVNSEEIPPLNNRNVVRLTNISDLVDAQQEIRKPIYFKEYDKSCAFVLFDSLEVCVYLLKENDDIFCPYEDIINQNISRQKKDKSNNKEYNLLNSIDKTTIIKLDNKSLKISPIKKESLIKTDLLPKVKDTD